MRTYVAKGEEAEALKAGPNWFVIDATDAVLGRLATRAARILIGKDKPSFTILGMLPKNKLQARRAKKLRVYRDAAGLARHAGQKPRPVAL